ncbi:MAG: phosphoribosyl-ATP pyrophosphohydrolase [Patescibacteria group bacterium]|nr:phosphoribosyl-ATP pyrophosphohydrolase [Patescibacteria group bacterium]
MIANIPMVFLLRESLPPVGWHAEWLYSWTFIKGLKLIKAGAAGYCSAPGHREHYCRRCDTISLTLQCQNRKTGLKRKLIMSFEHTETDHVLENEYPKLVRDKIPQLVKEDKGKEAAIRPLTDDAEFLQYLLKKVAEEADELARAMTDSNIQEEITDVYEIIEAIIRLRGFSSDEIKSIQEAKRAKRGGFEQRLLMLRKP